MLFSSSTEAEAKSLRNRLEKLCSARQNSLHSQNLDSYRAAVYLNSGNVLQAELQAGNLTLDSKNGEISDLQNQHLELQAKIQQISECLEGAQASLQATLQELTTTTSALSAVTAAKVRSRLIY